MVQVWEIDSNGFYTGVTDFIEAPLSNHTTIALTTNYVKAQLVNGAWIEGATSEEVAAWHEEHKELIEPTIEDTITDLTNLVIDLQFQIDTMNV